MNQQPKRILPSSTPPPRKPGPPVTTGQRHVLRVNRACTSCRRQKMRCEGADNPPCARCKAAGSECVFEKVAKPEAMDSNSLERLVEMESQIAAVKTNQSEMQSTLAEILKELRRPASRPQPVGTLPPHSNPSGLDPIPPIATASTNQSTQSRSSLSPASITGSIPANADHLRPHLRTGSLQQPSSSTGPYHTPVSEYGGNASSANLKAFQPGFLAPPHPSLPNQLAHTRHGTFPLSPRPVPHGHRSHINTMDPRKDSGASSPANSDVDIPSHALVAPIEVINDLADVPADERPRKRKRIDIGEDSDITRNRSHSLSRMPHKSGPTQEQCIVTKGVICDSEARELFSLYFSGCHRVLAMFDPRVDTYESLRARSPFCFACVLMVAAIVRDGGAPPSPLQIALYTEAIQMSKETLCTPPRLVEVVQGMLLIAAWSHSEGGAGWVMAGHAVRVAVDIGAHQALQQLELRRKAGFQDDDMDRLLVRASRTWCALFVFEYQLAFGMRRPAMMGDEARNQISIARDVLLSHPLSIPTDIRLVSTCELLCIQSRIHAALGPEEEDMNETQTLNVLREARLSIDGWRSEWDNIMGMNHSPDGFFRSSAAIQQAYAILFHNSLAIRNIRTRSQAKAISPDVKSVAFEAVDAAREALNIVLNNHEYRDGLKFAVSYTHTCAAFAGAFLLRMARLFPHDFNINDTYNMVENVANLLSEVPAKRYSEALSNMLDSLKQRSRQSNIVTPVQEQTHLNKGSNLHVLDFGYVPMTFNGNQNTGNLPGENNELQVEAGGPLPDPIFPSWLMDMSFNQLFPHPQWP